MNRPRVFLPIETPRFDVTPAESFGEPLFLLKTKNMSPFQSNLIFSIFRSELAQHRFDPTRDFIAMTGPTNFVGLLLLFIGAEYPNARLLLFDARVNEYVERPGPHS